MNLKSSKDHPTIACCGIDCGLCPRYYTAGSSRCPGCFGANFFQVHPACGILTCCVKKHGFETCGECPDFPCEKLHGWDQGDSFVCHQVTLQNLRQIKQSGLKEFLEQQHERMAILSNLLKDYNDNRSKDFYCLATALLPVVVLQASMNKIEQKVQSLSSETLSKGQKATIAKEILQQSADTAKIPLKFNRKSSKK